MFVHDVPLVDVWIWNERAYAASQLSCTWQIGWLVPRSTCSHCGSLKALDHRVPLLPSTAADAGVPAFSVDDAVAGLFSAAFVVPHGAADWSVPKTWNSQSE